MESCGDAEILVLTLVGGRGGEAGGPAEEIRACLMGIEGEGLENG